MTLQVLQESGVDTRLLRSKHVEEIDASALDLVVTVCDHARESCPHLPGAFERLHWPFDDPAAATGTTAEVLAVFRRVRDEIRSRIQEYTAC
jgi:arsenate reductase